MASAYHTSESRDMQERMEGGCFALCFDRQNNQEINVYQGQFPSMTAEAGEGRFGLFSSVPVYPLTKPPIEGAAVNVGISS